MSFFGGKKGKTMCTYRHQNKIKQNKVELGWKKMQTSDWQLILGQNTQNKGRLRAVFVFGDLFQPLNFLIVYPDVQSRFSKG